MKPTKKAIFALALMMLLALAACSNKNSTSDRTFPSVDNADIPDILEKTVGTLGDTYYTSFDASDNKDYQAVLVVTFKETTDEDYTELMEHYQSTSTGVDENGSLIYDWDWLQVTSDNGSISINALIK